ncbi:hypothetical protein Fcan01_24856 [Folsomia candida]|uniref:Uncharacterized protein n=1 Tax=Folsomia candida TaxID=158441 RepID=A0A226D5D6_FOLCA|nr:hypothetical protein Fcan01_24856 [Folsomia candida]
MPKAALFRRWFLLSVDDDDGAGVTTTLLQDLASVLIDSWASPASLPPSVWLVVMVANFAPGHLLKLVQKYGMTSTHTRTDAKKATIYHPYQSPTHAWSALIFPFSALVSPLNCLLLSVALLLPVHQESPLIIQITTKLFKVANTFPKCLFVCPPFANNRVIINSRASEAAKFLLGTSMSMEDAMQLEQFLGERQPLRGVYDSILITGVPTTRLYNYITSMLSTCSNVNFFKAVMETGVLVGTQRYPIHPGIRLPLPKPFSGG